jgi:hypothetical protein
MFLCRLFLAMAVVLALPGLSGSPAAVGPERPTRADLDRLRRRVALLESEHALGLSRKPYLVLDLGSRTLRYGLLGMALRELPLDGAEARGFVSVSGTGAPASTAVAGILTLDEKEKDPRLSPLTPAQIEAGATDEDAADVLPPEVPEDYALIFKQSLFLQVEGSPKEKGVGGVLSSVGAWWRWLWGPGVGRSGTRASARVTVYVDEATAREVYRSLVPGQRVVLVPPTGLLLPEAGQETPRSIRAAKRAAPPPAEPEGAPGVPFRIPPPLESPGGEVPSETPDGEGEIDAEPAPGDEASPDDDRSPGDDESPVPEEGPVGGEDDSAAEAG